MKSNWNPQFGLLNPGGCLDKFSCSLYISCQCSCFLQHVRSTSLVKFEKFLEITHGNGNICRINMNSSHINPIFLDDSPIQKRITNPWCEKGKFLQKIRWTPTSTQARRARRQWHLANIAGQLGERDGFRWVFIYQHKVHVPVVDDNYNIV